MWRHLLNGLLSCWASIQRCASSPHEDQNAKYSVALCYVYMYSYVYVYIYICIDRQIKTSIYKCGVTCSTVSSPAGPLSSAVPGPPIKIKMGNTQVHFAVCVYVCIYRQIDIDKYIDIYIDRINPIHIYIYIYIYIHGYISGYNPNPI